MNPFDLVESFLRISVAVVAIIVIGITIHDPLADVLYPKLEE